jgi:myo-inositol-1(or 4)-monophosphatase
LVRGVPKKAPYSAKLRAMLPKLPFEMSAVVGIAREAARLALELHGRAAVEVKPDNTLVTEADRALEAMLHERLGELAPNWSFLGEETGLTGASDKPCWVIDPIDGTTNFVRGLPIWCVSIGAVQNGKAIFGAVAVPPQGELYYGATGQGAWREAHGKVVRLQVTDRAALTQEDLIATNSTLRDINLSRVPCRHRNLGSLTYHLLAASRGSILASVSQWHKLYDVAAGICLCEEAGCQSQLLGGAPWHALVTSKAETTPLLVAPPKALAQLQEAFKKENS